MKEPPIDPVSVNDAAPEPETPEKENSVSRWTADEIANKYGWRPERTEKDDPNRPWITDPGDYVIKEIENGRKSQKALRQMRQEMQALQRTVRELREQMEAQANPALSLQQLESQFERAVEEGDTKQARELRDLIVQMQLRDKRRTEPDEREVLRDKRMLEEWKEENPWYEEEEDMARYADTVFSRYQGRDGKLTEPLEDVLEKVNEKVRKKFSSFFNKNPGPERMDVADVAPARGTITPGKRITWHQLTPQQKAFCEDAVRDGTFKNHQEWIDARFNQSKKN